MLIKNSKTSISLTRLSFLSLCFLFFFCGLAQTKNSKGKVSKYYESFFVGEEGTQYFLKPMEFTSNRESLWIDFSFRYKDKIKGEAIVNFSINSEDIFKSLSSITFTNEIDKYTYTSINLLFNEKNGDGNFTSRFSVNIPLEDLNTLFKGINWTISPAFEKGISTFKPSRKTIKILELFKNDLFVLL